MFMCFVLQVVFGISVILQYLHYWCHNGTANNNVIADLFVVTYREQFIL